MNEDTRTPCVCNPTELLTRQRRFQPVDPEWDYTTHTLWGLGTIQATHMDQHGDMWFPADVVFERFGRRESDAAVFAEYADYHHELIAAPRCVCGAGQEQPLYLSAKGIACVIGQSPWRSEIVRNFHADLRKAAVRQGHLPEWMDRLMGSLVDDEEPAFTVA